MANISPSSIVLDVGTGYTKMGFAGNQLPSFVIPSAIATRGGPSAGSGGSSRAPPPPSKPSSLSGGGGSSSSNLASKRGVEDLDFFIGDEALAAGRGHGYGVHYPVRHGIIENWDLMEKYWQQCIFKYLRAEPEDHCFLLVSGASPLSPLASRRPPPLCGALFPSITLRHSALLQTGRILSAYFLSFHSHLQRAS
jgi:actin-related protein 3